MPPRLAAILLAASLGVAEPTPSALWGEAGELWDPAGRLPDFSHAGYRSGESPIPDVAVVARVTDFGAVPDDEGDDTAAFQRAVAETDSGALLIPAGRYILTDRVSIRRSGVVLRGEGPGRTVLVFPKGLEHIDPKPTTNSGGRPLSGYSWSDGFLGIRGSARDQVLSEIAAPARRGDRRLKVAHPRAVSAGMDVTIELRDDDDKTLLAYLYGGDPGDTSAIRPATTRALQVVRILHLEGDVAVLDRPLRYDIRPQWRPHLRAFVVSVSDSGIESLTVEFPARAYQGHFTEAGYNAVAFANVRDCWVRNIEIVNADCGIISSAWFCTFANVTFRATDDAVPFRGDFGHHGILVSRTDNLVTGFDFRHRFIHDLTVTSTSAANVFSNGRGVDLCFDHHKRAPHANLFTALDAGAATRLWRSGGGANLGRHCAAWETFWGIRTPGPVARQSGWSTDLVNFVGLALKDPPATTTDGLWIEAIPAHHLVPANLHEAQLARRLARIGASEATPENN
jgi:hypothetical protein